MVAAYRPLFSVIIPTRNRSPLCAIAFQSVLNQRFCDFEVLVVNDGSSAEHEIGYRQLVEPVSDVARLVTLEYSERGHGPSYALNFGADQARGEYLCFLDDDDEWTDPEYLGRSAHAIAANTETPDMILANQQAFWKGVPVERLGWIGDLQDRLSGIPDAAGAYTVTPMDLLRCQAHCHRNTTIVSRALYGELGGLDEGLRYEEDRDFYLRAVDRATIIKFLPFIVSRHNIPDLALRASISTAESELSKRLYQLRVFDKAVLFSVRAELRRYAMRQRTYILKHIATEAARADHLDCAAYYAREALVAKFTPGWLGMTVLFTLRRLFSTKAMV